MKEKLRQMGMTNLVTEQLLDEYKPFWHDVNRLLGEHPEHKDGYICVLAGYRQYRSLLIENRVYWLSWLPYEVFHHFSAIPEQRAEVFWVSDTKAPLTDGFIRLHAGGLI